jgi:Response regulator containing a CheY-like receiver domain and an HTH DNA-binding domain
VVGDRTTYARPLRLQGSRLSIGINPALRRLANSLVHIGPRTTKPQIKQLVTRFAPGNDYTFPNTPLHGLLEGRPRHFVGKAVVIVARPSEIHSIRADHAMVRQGLRCPLEADPRIEVVGEAIDGDKGTRV